MEQALMDILRCPRCRSGLDLAAAPAAAGVRCTLSSCHYHNDGFPLVDGMPALVDFDVSIINRDGLMSRRGASVIERAGSLRVWLRQLVTGNNPVAAGNCAQFLAELRKVSARPRVLVVGGGARGAGTEPLYEGTDVQVVGTDIYASDNVAVIADGHALPFADGSFDGVWIQAVLEHVLEPAKVVAEMERVLTANGIVYAETPFMQQVHEAAYDFTRFTRSGHRWLFREFAEIRSGNVAGPGTSLVWSLRYLARSLTRSDKAATLLVAPFFWLRYLDRMVDDRYASDSANGVYFLGRRGGQALTPRDMVAYYTGPR